MGEKDNRTVKQERDEREALENLIENLAVLWHNGVVLKRIEKAKKEAKELKAKSWISGLIARRIRDGKNPFPTPNEYQAIKDSVRLVRFADPSVPESSRPTEAEVWEAAQRLTGAFYLSLDYGGIVGSTELYRFRQKIKRDIPKDCTCSPTPDKYQAIRAEFHGYRKIDIEAEGLEPTEAVLEERRQQARHREEIPSGVCLRCQFNRYIHRVPREQLVEDKANGWSHEFSTLIRFFLPNALITAAGQQNVPQLFKLPEGGWHTDSQGKKLKVEPADIPFDALPAFLRTKARKLCWSWLSEKPDPKPKNEDIDDFWPRCPFCDSRCERVKKAWVCPACGLGIPREFIYPTDPPQYLLSPGLLGVRRGRVKFKRLDPLDAAVAPLKPRLTEAQKEDAEEAAAYSLSDRQGSYGDLWEQPYPEIPGPGIDHLTDPYGIGPVAFQIISSQTSDRDGEFTCEPPGEWDHEAFKYRRGEEAEIAGVFRLKDGLLITPKGNYLNQPAIRRFLDKHDGKTFREKYEAYEATRVKTDPALIQSTFNESVFQPCPICHHLIATSLLADHIEGCESGVRVPARQGPCQAIWGRLASPIAFETFGTLRTLYRVVWEAGIPIVPAVVGVTEEEKAWLREFDGKRIRTWRKTNPTIWVGGVPLYPGPESWRRFTNCSDCSRYQEQRARNSVRIQWRFCEALPVIPKSILVGRERCPHYVYIGQQKETPPRKMVQPSSRRMGSSNGTPFSRSEVKLQESVKSSTFISRGGRIEVHRIKALSVWAPHVAFCPGPLKLLLAIERFEENRVEYARLRQKVLEGVVERNRGDVERLCEMLVEGNCSTQKELADELGKKDYWVSRTIKRLVKIERDIAKAKKKQKS